MHNMQGTHVTGFFFSIPTHRMYSPLYSLCELMLHMLLKRNLIKPLTFMRENTFGLDAIQWK